MTEILNSNSVKTIIGNRLRQAREGKGYKRQQLCTELQQSALSPGTKELNQSTLKQWELGTNAINIEWIPAICDVLGVDVGYLFGEYEGGTKEKTDVSSVLNLNFHAVDTLFWLARDDYKIQQEFIEDLLSSPIGLHEISIAYQEYKKIPSGKQLAQSGVEPDDMVIGPFHRPMSALEAERERDIALFRLQKAIIRFVGRDK